MYIHISIYIYIFICTPTFNATHWSNIASRFNRSDTEICYRNYGDTHAYVYRNKLYKCKCIQKYKYIIVYIHL